MKARRVMNEDRLSLAQMERLRAELRPNLVFVLELVRRELDELRVDQELIRRELEDIQALLHDATQRNASSPWLILERDIGERLPVLVAES